VIVSMAVAVVMIVVVVMILPVAVIVVVGVSVVSGKDLHTACRDAVSLGVADPVDDIEVVLYGIEDAGIGAGREQGGEEHIAAGAHPAIEGERSHTRKPRAWSEKPRGRWWEPPRRRGGVSHYHINPPVAGTDAGEQKAYLRSVQR
jgi:hypothetical protein